MKEGSEIGEGPGDDPFADDDDEPTATDLTDTEQPDVSSGESRVPWLYRRANARDGRPKTKQLHLQESTARQESQFKSDAEAAVDERVKLTDLREAALLVAMDHVDEVADQLREWGYDANL